MPINFLLKLDESFLIAQRKRYLKKGLPHTMTWNSWQQIRNRKQLVLAPKEIISH